MGIMFETPRQEIALATADQAQAMLEWVTSTTEVHGKHYSFCDSYGEVAVTEVPDKISQHYPTPDADSESVRYNLDVTRQRDHKTHQLRTQGVLAIISF